MEQLSVQNMEALLREQRVAHVGVVDGNEPYVGPLSFVYTDGSIVFRTGDGRRLTALRKNPRVSIEVSRTDQVTGSWKSVIVAGTAEFVDENDTGAMITALLGKYRDMIDPLLGASGPLLIDANHVVRVSIDTMSGRSSSSLFGQAMRPGRL